MRLLLWTAAAVRGGPSSDSRQKIRPPFCPHGLHNVDGKAWFVLTSFASVRVIATQRRARGCAAHPVSRTGVLPDGHTTAPHGAGRCRVCMYGMCRANGARVGCRRCRPKRKGDASAPKDGSNHTRGGTSSRGRLCDVRIVTGGGCRDTRARDLPPFGHTSVCVVCRTCRVWSDDQESIQQQDGTPAPLPYSGAHGNGGYSINSVMRGRNRTDLLVALPSDRSDTAEPPLRTLWIPFAFARRFHSCQRPVESFTGSLGNSLIRRVVAACCLPILTLADSTIVDNGRGLGMTVDRGS